jgi:hypothetical protein
MILIKPSLLVIGFEVAAEAMFLSELELNALCATKADFSDERTVFEAVGLFRFQIKELEPTLSSYDHVTSSFIK